MYLENEKAPLSELEVLLHLRQARYDLAAEVADRRVADRNRTVEGAIYGEARQQVAKMKVCPPVPSGTKLSRSISKPASVSHFR